jgi:hypothetical protein
MKHSCCWVEIGREKVLVVAPTRHPDGDGKIGETTAPAAVTWQSHVDDLEIHWGLVRASVVHIKMYGAGLTGENADRVLY